MFDKILPHVEFSLISYEVIGKQRQNKEIILGKKDLRIHLVSIAKDFQKSFVLSESHLSRIRLDVV